MPAEKPLVYCIIINWNGKELLRETLDSVLQMDYPNAKVVVVDNGSTDGSQEVVRTSYPSVVLLENGKNLGFGGGNNVAIQFALERDAAWILLLNNDVSVDRSMLNGLMTIAVTDDRIGALSPKIYYHSPPDVIWYAGGRVNFWTGAVSHIGLRVKDRGQYDTVSDTEYISGCAFLARSAVLKQTGLFDAIYFPAYSEDADLSERIRRAGYRLVYTPSAKLWHKVSSSSGGGLTPFKAQLKVEHNLIFFKKYARWYHWLTIPWFVGAMTLVFVMREFFKGNFTIISALVRGFGKALRRLVAGLC